MFTAEEKLILLDAVVRFMCSVDKNHPRIDVIKGVRDKLINSFREV